MLSLQNYLIVSGIIFTLGILGIVVQKKNIIQLLMSVELILLSVNINFIAFAYFLHNFTGQVFVFFILTVAAAETAIGLAILMCILRHEKSVDVTSLNQLKG